MFAWSPPMVRVSFTVADECESESELLWMLEITCSDSNGSRNSKRWS